MTEVADNIADAVTWNADGLVPAVAIDANGGHFLMMAWMNRQALADTIATGYAHFYSRSRKTQWKKGETSGNVLTVKEIRLDCDGDTVVLTTRPAGPACHTGKASCAFRRLDHGAWIEDDGPAATGPGILATLADVIEDRRTSSEGKSYVKSLLAKGRAKTLAKLREEHQELQDELDCQERDPGRVAAESADLLFHWMVALAEANIDPELCWAELRQRFGVSGHVEKASRKTGGGQ